MTAEQPQVDEIASSARMMIQAHDAPGEQAAALRESWTHAIELLQQDLRRRDAAPRTRRAYGVDVEQFASWACARPWAQRKRWQRGCERAAIFLS